MKVTPAATSCLLLCLSTLAPARIASAQAMKPEMLAQFEQKTGLEPVEIPDTQGTYLGKTHRGYRLVFTAKAGNVAQSSALLIPCSGATRLAATPDTSTPTMQHSRAVLRTTPR